MDKVKIRKPIKVSRQRVTRQAKQAYYYGGSPNDLHNREPCTYRELIQYFYFVKISNPNMKDFNVAEYITSKLKEVWGLVSTTLPLFPDKSITKKVWNVMSKAKCINSRKGSTKAAKNFLEKKLDTLFDISACLCGLPDNIPCNDR